MTELRFNVADTDIVVSATAELLALVDRLLLHVDRESRGRSVPLKIESRFESGVWRIAGQAPASHKALGVRSTLAQVAGAVVSSLLAEIGYHRNLEVWRATAVERDGSALIFIGDDWESSVTLGAHLHTRGWKILGGDYALIHPDTLVVSACKKLLYADSSCIASFPVWYRRAIEASPWSSSARSIAFYAIDPQIVEPSPWARSAPLAAIVKLDGQFADRPSLETLDRVALTGTLHTERLRKAGIEVAELVLGDFIETCDLIERWFAPRALPV